MGLTCASLARTIDKCHVIVLSLEASEIVRQGDRCVICGECNHTEVALGGEVGECETSRPVRCHLGAEESLDFGPETGRRGDAAELAEIGWDIQVCEIAVRARIGRDACIAAPFTVGEILVGKGDMDLGIRTSC